MAAMLSACSHEIDEPTLNPVQPGQEQKEASDEAPVTELSVVVPTIDIVPDAEPEVKTSVSTSGQFTWVTNDKLGFWPDPTIVQYGAPQQSIFYVSTTSGDGSHATFKANGWGLLRNQKYYSYYPYDETAKSDAITVKYTGQNQASNNSSGNLGKFDYLHSSFVMPSSGVKELNYDHLGGIAKLTLTFTSEYAATLFTDMTLSSTSSIFVESAVYNPSVDAVTYTSSAKKTSLAMKLNSGNGFKANSSYQVILFMMLNPTSWSDKAITVTVNSSDGKVFSGAFTPTSNLAAGKGAAFTVKMTCTGGAVDLGKSETANCYIVSKAGEYKFKTVKGNTNNSVGTVASAKVLWESQATTDAPAAKSIISSVSYKDNYITFKTPDTFKKGNAVIAACDASGNILWSWHIWCTDQPATVQYMNNAGYLMDRNLGAIATTGAKSTGLLYQWGRKDPFPGTASLSKASVQKTTATFTYTATTSSTGTIAWTTKNPTTFLYGTAATNIDWFYKNSVDTRTWKGTDGAKTQYDPCPPGYKVPAGSTDVSTSAGRGFWGKALGMTFRLTATNNVFSSSSGNVTFDATNHTFTMPVSGGGYAYYPAAGGINDSDGTLGFAGLYMFQWTDGPGGADDSKNWNTQYSSVLDVNMSSNDGAGYLTVNWNCGRASGRSVRCQLIKMNTTTSSAANETYSGESGSW